MNAWLQHASRRLRISRAADLSDLPDTPHQHLALADLLAHAGDGLVQDQAGMVGAVVAEVV